MNKIISSFLLVAILATGCATYLENTGKTLASVAITVDGAMKGWASWVKTGHATQANEDSVKAAYEKYQLAMQTAEDAYLSVSKLSTPDTQKAVTVALAALDGCKNDLLTIIQQLSK